MPKLHVLPLGFDNTGFRGSAINCVDINIVPLGFDNIGCSEVIRIVQMLTFANTVFFFIIIKKFAPEVTS